MGDKDGTKRIKIPSHIQYLSFRHCMLDSLRFEDDSELESISFDTHTDLKHVFHLPPKTREVRGWAYRGGTFFIPPSVTFMQFSNQYCSFQIAFFDFSNLITLHIGGVRSSDEIDLREASQLMTVIFDNDIYYRQILLLPNTVRTIRGASDVLQ